MIPRSSCQSVCHALLLRFSRISSIVPCVTRIMVRWWMNCVYETNPALGILPKQGGSLYYTLYLPTMEVFVWFRPEE